jgi:hypothetical protein
MKTNVAVKSPSPRTHEGGVASRISKKEELKRTIMSCLLFENSFYEDGVSIADRVTSLAKEVKIEDAITIMKMASKEYKLRHAPLWLALALLQRDGLAPEDIAAVITRADSLAEILAMYWKDGKRPLSHKLRKALDIAIRMFSEYSLAKYDRDGAVRLRDVFRIVRPKPTSLEQSELWKKAVARTLKTPDTWEVALSAGKDKKKTWERLLKEDALGDLAFLRNLRNMASANVDRELILSSFAKRTWDRILPYQFIAAAKYAPDMERYLDSAMQKAMGTMDRLGGKTAILVDVSGSMDGQLASKSELTRWDAATALAMLLEGVCADLRVFEFDNRVREIPARKGFGLRASFTPPSGGTEMWAAISSIPGDYDRVIVITDEQTSDHGNLPNNGTMYYIMNVATDQNGVGYGKNSVHISGFSEASVRYIAEFEKDRER